MLIFHSTAKKGKIVQLSQLLAAKLSGSNLSGGRVSKSSTGRVGSSSSSIAKPKTPKSGRKGLRTSMSTSKTSIPAVLRTSSKPTHVHTSKKTPLKSVNSTTATIAMTTTTASGTRLKSRKSKSSTNMGVDLTAPKSERIKTGKPVTRVPGSHSEVKISTSTTETTSNIAAGPENAADDDNTNGNTNTGNNSSIQKITGFKVISPTPLLKKANMWDLTLYMTRIQNYFQVLGYQRQGEPKITINTHTSLRNLNETAKKLIRAGEPIKCLHALVLSIHLTNCSLLVERFPINFKSKFNNREYKHVVLGIYMFGRFGALGISRDAGLQSKSNEFVKLGDLLDNFHKAYSEAGHELLEVRIGGTISHDPHSLGTIHWKLGNSIDMKKDPDDVQIEINRVSKLLRAQMGQICLRNSQLHQPDTKSVNPNILTKEYILEQSSVQLARSRSTPAAAATSKKLKTVKDGGAMKLEIGKARSSAYSALAKFNQVSASTSISNTTFGLRNKKGIKMAFR